MNIIVLQHIKIEDPGYIKDLMLVDGVKLTTIELDEGEKIPNNLSQFDGMFCMGGPMDTYMEKSYTLIRQEFNNPQNIEEKNLLIFENNLSFEITDFKENKFKKIYIVSNKNENRSIKLSEKLLKFKSLLMDDQRQRLKDKSIDCEVIDISEIKNIESYYSFYPTVGENLDYINSNNLKMNFLYRNLDQLAWQYCNKGFFNFKSYIPKIISSFN